MFYYVNVIAFHRIENSIGISVEVVQLYFALTFLSLNHVYDGQLIGIHPLSNQPKARINRIASGRLHCFSNIESHLFFFESYEIVNKQTHKYNDTSQKKNV